MRTILALPLVLAASVGIASVGAAQDAAPAPGCPCTSYGPYPCAAAALVALPDQGARLGLTASQDETLRRLREEHLHAVDEILGDIDSLRDALDGLDRPYEPAEVFALYYDLGRHEAELAETYETGAAALLDVLDADQRARWDVLVAEAADAQEPAVECGSAP